MYFLISLMFWLCNISEYKDIWGFYFPDENFNISKTCCFWLPYNMESASSITIILMEVLFKNPFCISWWIRNGVPIIMMTPSPNFFGSFLILAKFWISKPFFYPRFWNSRYCPSVFRFCSIYRDSSLDGEIIMA